jgi:hypothetical protein
LFLVSKGRDGLIIMGLCGGKPPAARLPLPPAFPFFLFGSQNKWLIREVLHKKRETIRDFS